MYARVALVRDGEELAPRAGSMVDSGTGRERREGGGTMCPCPPQASLHPDHIPNLPHNSGIFSFVVWC